jgi:hypothetical protein
MFMTEHSEFRSTNLIFDKGGSFLDEISHERKLSQNFIIILLRVTSSSPYDYLFNRSINNSPNDYLFKCSAPIIGTIMRHFFL